MKFFLWLFDVLYIVGCGDCSRNEKQFDEDDLSSRGEMLKLTISTFEEIVVLTWSWA